MDEVTVCGKKLERAYPVYTSRNTSCGELVNNPIQYNSLDSQSSSILYCTRTIQYCMGLFATASTVLNSTTSENTDFG